MNFDPRQLLDEDNQVKATVLGTRNAYAPAPNKRLSILIYDALK